MNLIDNKPEDVLYTLKFYKTICKVFATIIFILIVCLYKYIKYSELQQGRIENLEMANNSKNYINGNN